jgi:hydrogenase maturation protease
VTRDDVLVLGIGNVLAGDEGVGVHAVRALAPASFPAHVRLLDGGTGGLQLLGCLHDYRRLVIVDATMDGRPPGAVALRRPRFASDFPRTLGAHDIGLRDLIEAAVLLGELPDIDLITVSIAAPQPMSLQLTTEVRRALPEVERLVRAAIDRRPDAAGSGGVNGAAAAQSSETR